MTRAKAIERALRAYDDHGEAEKLADAGLIAGIKSRVRFWLTCDNFSDRAICEAFEALLLHCDDLEERLRDQDSEK